MLANAETLSGNIVTNISDHIAQFLSFPLKQTHEKKNEISKILMLALIHIISDL